MSRMRKTIITAIIMGTIAIGGNFSVVKAEEDKVLAQVGDEKITVKEFEEQVKSLPPQLQVMVSSNPEAKGQLLESWVQMNLFAKEAKTLKLDDDPAFKTKFAKVRDSLLAQEFVKKELEKALQIKPEDIKKFYDEHKNEFVKPESVHARHILVKVDQNADEKAKKAVEAKANDIKKKLAGGKDFAELAKEFSDDPGSKQKGGDLGFFPKGRMVPEFEKAAFELKVNEVSNPVKSNFGYHIIQVLEKKAQEEMKYEDVSRDIEERLKAQKQEEQIESVSEKLKAKYTVKINKELLPKSEPAAMPKDHPKIDQAPAPKDNKKPAVK